MKFIKGKWRTFTLIYFIATYLLFFQVYPNLKGEFFYAVLAYFIVSMILFLGTFIGYPGLLLHTATQNDELASKFYRPSIALGTTNPNILSAYGLIKLRQNNAAEALGYFQKALDHATHIMYIKTLRGNISICYWKLGQIEKAYTTYEELFYYPDLDEIDDFSEENLDEGIYKNSSFTSQDFVTLGYLSMLMKKYEEATYYSKIALSIDENYAAAYDNLGQIAYFTNDFEEAKKQFLLGLEHKDTVDSLYYMALIAENEGNISEASAYIKRASDASLSGLNTVKKQELTQAFERLA